MTLVTRTTMWLCAIADDLKQPDRQCIALSALGQKQTCAAQNVMSALRPKADMCSANRHVCFGPKADIEPPIRSPRRRHLVDQKAP